MAVGWSPAGWNSVCITKRLPPSSLLTGADPCDDAPARLHKYGQGVI
jgi:hypothetical protein